MFDGTISTRLEDFYIEPVSRYVEQKSSAPNFHTIVYRSSDVATPHLTQPCASQLFHLHNIQSQATEGHSASVRTEGSHVDFGGNNWNLEIGGGKTSTVQINGSHGQGFESRKMNHFSEAADGEQTANTVDIVHKINRENGDGAVGDKDCQSDRVVESDGTRGAGCDPVGRSHNKKRSNKWSRDEVTQNAETIYRRTTRSLSRHDTYYHNPNVLANITLPSAAVPDEVFVVRHVHKRATVDPKKTTCMLYLQADHLFYQKYGTEEACIEVMTRHVQRVNSIYKTTGTLHC